jgi:hypothetical protein
MESFVLYGAYRVAKACVYEKPNAQVNRQKCGAFLSVLNLQLGFQAPRCDAHCAKETG